jgi:hypothetical protein
MPQRALEALREAFVELTCNLSVSQRLHLWHVWLVQALPRPLAEEMAGKWALTFSAFADTTAIGAFTPWKKLRAQWLLPATSPGRFVIQEGGLLIDPESRDVSLATAATYDLYRVPGTGEGTVPSNRPATYLNGLQMHWALQVAACRNVTLPEAPLCPRIWVVHQDPEFFTMDLSQDAGAVPEALLDEAERLLKTCILPDGSIRQPKRAQGRLDPDEWLRFLLREELIGRLVDGPGTLPHYVEVMGNVVFWQFLAAVWRSSRRFANNRFACPLEFFHKDSPQQPLARAQDCMATFNTEMLGRTPLPLPGDEATAPYVQVMGKHWLDAPLAG